MRDDELALTAAEQQVRIVVPFVAGKLRPETVAALAGFEVDYQELRGDEAYFELLRGLWTEGRTFVVIEEDVVAQTWQIEELVSCNLAWCAAPYRYTPGGLTLGLGFARFSAELIAMMPNAMEVVGLMYDEEHPPKHWCRLDLWLARVLRAGGHQTHVHEIVKHLGVGFAHGCEANIMSPGELAAADAVGREAELAGERLWAASPAERPAARWAAALAYDAWVTTMWAVLVMRGEAVADLGEMVRFTFSSTRPSRRRPPAGLLS